MEGLDRIQKASGRLMWALRVCVALVPVLVGVFWAVVGHNEVLARQLPVALDRDIPNFTMIGGYLVTMVPGAVTMYLLAQLSCLFGLYRQGTFFSAGNVAIFRHLGWGVLLWTICDFLYTPAVGIVLTLHRAAGQRLLVLSLSSHQLLMTLVGLVVLTISWVMDEARKNEDERSLFI